MRHAIRLLLVVLVMVASFARPALASPYPAHGQVITVGHGTCSVDFRHGNYGSKAYAAFDMRPGAVCWSGTKVTVTNGQLLSTTCALGQSSCYGSGWHTAQRVGSILGSNLVLCGYPPPSGCAGFNYSGI